MEVRPGYKQTEVGVIPEEWDCVAVQMLVDENILEKPLDGNHGNIHPKSSDFVDYGIPFVMANNFLDGNVDLLGCKFITKERAAKLQKGFSIAGDVLLTHKGTVGNTAIVPELSVDFIMLTPQVTYYRVKDETRLNNGFLRQYFDSQPFQSLFKSLAGGGTRAYLGIIKQLALPIIKPPIDEQRAIAAALSDVDALLGGLDRLIAKKRDLKQAAMQQLLTGQTRLPGFHGEWEVKPIASIAPLQRGFDLPTRDLTPGPFPVVYSNGVEAFHNKFMVKGPGVVTGRSGTLGRVHYVEADFWPHNTSLWVTRFGNNVPKFIYYLYRALRFERFSSGSGVPTLNRNDAHTYETAIPSDPDEQRAISAVLSDMDAELAALEARRDKTRALKQAMMQELLTGKTRLVPAGGAHA